MKFISFPKITDFDHAIKDIIHYYRYAGLDEDNKPVYNTMMKLPTLTVMGTEKIHGTNAGYCVSTTGETWCQSREHIITPLKDNAGWAQFCNKPEVAEALNHIACRISQIYKEEINDDAYTVALFFEWAGGNIQKKSACTDLEKQAFLFASAKIEFHNSEKHSIWVPTGHPANGSLKSHENKIFNVLDFETYTFEIDLNAPALFKNQFIELVEKIEKESPIGKYFGKQNVGEGVVVEVWYGKEQLNQLTRFKVKGTEHSNSKVKTLKPVDNVKEQAKIDFANSTCTAGRLEQGWQKVFGIDYEICTPSKEKVADFIRWVREDIISEELDLLSSLNLEVKDINGPVSILCKNWYFEQLGKYTLGE